MKEEHEEHPSVLESGYFRAAVFRISDVRGACTIYLGYLYFMEGRGIAEYTLVREDCGKL